MMWLGFHVAAEEVERQLGCSWDAAQEALLDACRNNQVRWRRDEGGLGVLDADFVRWLRTQGPSAEIQAKSPPAKGRPAAKSRRILNLLAMMFPDGVPDRARYPRNLLKANLIMWDPSLHPVDRATLGRAIDAYNADRNSRQRP